MTNYVYSTLTNDNIYHTYAAKSNEHQLNHIVKSIRIKGGANMCLESAGGMLSTQYGFVTEVSDEDLEFLEKNPCFIDHKKNGFLIVDKKKNDANDMASEMASKDFSAPKVSGDYKNHTVKKEHGKKTIIIEKNELNQA